jgi:hypothetical protein
VDIDRKMSDVQTRLARWRRERDALRAQLRDVIASGQAMLADLGGTGARASSAAAPSAPARRAPATPAPARKRKRRLSPEGRARIIAAAKKRWARYHREQKQG